MNNALVATMGAAALALTGSTGVGAHVASQAVAPPKASQSHPVRNRDLKPGDAVARVGGNADLAGSICQTGVHITDVAFNYDNSGTSYFLMTVINSAGTSTEYRSDVPVEYVQARFLLNMSISAMMSQAAVNIYVRGSCKAGSSGFVEGYAGLMIMAVS